MSGSKFDGGKPRMGLVHPDFIEGVAEVLTFGAKKYAAWNWAQGIEFDRLYDAAQRHLNAWNKGEDLDPESGKSHLMHAACELMFLHCFQKWGRLDLDNRYILDSVPSELRLHIPEGVPTTECCSQGVQVDSSSVVRDGVVRGDSSSASG